MKKAILIIVFGLLWCNVAFTEIREIEQDKMKYRKSDYATSRVVTTCIDGYKFVIVRATESIAITQAFEIRGDQSLPAVCPGIL